MSGLTLVGGVFGVLIYALVYICGLGAMACFLYCSGTYYFKKGDDWSIFVSFIAGCIITLIKLFGLAFIFSMFQFHTDDSFSLYLNAGLALSNIGVYSWAFYLAYLLGIYHLVLLLDENNVIHLNIKRQLRVKNTQQETAAQVPEETDVNQSESTEDVVVRRKPINKKVFAIAGGFIAVMLLCGAAWFIYDYFFNYTTIHFFENVKVEYTGNNGEGYAIFDAENDYDGNDEDIDEFLSTVYYEVEDNGELSNGDQLNVKLKYSVSLAKKYNIDVGEKTYTEKIKDLKDIYVDTESIPHELLEVAKAHAEKKMNDNFNNTSTIKTTSEFYSFYLLVNEKKNSNDLVAVFKLTSTSSDSEKEPSITYACVYTKNFSSAYLDDSSPYWYKRTLYDDSYNNVKDIKDIETGLSTLSSNQTILKID